MFSIMWQRRSKSSNLNNDLPDDVLVDYVRVYKYKDKITEEDRTGEYIQNKVVVLEHPKAIRAGMTAKIKVKYYAMEDSQVMVNLLNRNGWSFHGVDKKNVTKGTG